MAATTEKDVGCRLCLYKYTKDSKKVESKKLKDNSVLCSECFDKLFDSGDIFDLMDKCNKLEQESEHVFSLVPNCGLCMKHNHRTSDHRCKTCKKPISDRCEHIKKELRNKFNFSNDSDRRINAGVKRNMGLIDVINCFVKFLITQNKI